MSLTNSVLTATSKHPIYTPENCINRRQRRYACTSCSSVCSRGVFSLKSGESLKWERCVNCGLCVTACPSRCFLPMSADRRYYTEGLDLNKPVSFACRNEEEESDRRVRCLAAVPWELLAMIAMRTELVLYTGACAACGREGWAELVQDQLTQLRTFLGEERWSRQVHVLTAGRFEAPAATEEDGNSEKELSRRALFSGLKKRAAKELYQAAADRLPLLAEDSEDGMLYRRALAESVIAEQKRSSEAPGHGETPPDYGVRLPRFSANCYGCGICEKLCPQKAIGIGEEKDGTRLIFITPWKCAGCSLCFHICPHGGITEMRTIRVPRLTELALVRVPSASCERCGTAIPPENDPKLCPSCAVKKKK